MAMDVTTEAPPVNLVQEDMTNEGTHVPLPVNVTKKAMQKDVRKDVTEDATKDATLVNAAQEGMSVAPAARVTKKYIAKAAAKEAPWVKVAWDAMVKEAAHSYYT